MESPASIEQVRRPTWRVLYNGQALPTPSRMSVASNTNYQADTFSVEWPLVDPERDSDWWGRQDQMLLDLQASLDAGQTWHSLLVGEVDSIDVELAPGRVSAEGRDLSARLIGAKTQETFLNRSASEVVEELARRHGLKPVATPTKGAVGRYYERDHESIRGGEFRRSTTEWDLLASFARNENFDLYVKGTELHFGPREGRDGKALVVRYGGAPGKPTLDALSVRLERSLTLAKELEVHVRSWSSGKKTGFTKIARTARGGKSDSKEPDHVLVRPNLSEDQAQKLANSILEELSRHERRIEVVRPGDFALSARSMVRLEGAGASWAQDYYVQEIRSELGWDSGFTQTVTARNRSPDVVTQVG